MPQFVHLHVHTQYSILDGQASIPRLVDKAMADGQPGIAVTDHGDMFGIKEFFNYVQKVKGKNKDKAAECEARIAALRDGTEACADPAAEIAKCEKQLAECKRRLAFKPIIGCEVYVARRRLHDKEGKPDQSGYHLILLAKNLKGYHNLIKIVSKAWTDGFYMRPRTDRAEIEKYHEGLICCSACLAGEVPRAITANDLEKADESIQWHKKVFGDDYYLELQLHKATVERANHEAYPMQLHVNKYLRELAAKHNVRMVCTNDVHDRIRGADVGQKLVAEALALGRALDEASDVDKLDHRRGLFLWLIHLSQIIQPHIRHGDHADVRVDGAERIVGDFRARVRNGVEQRGLADVRQADDTEFHRSEHLLRFPAAAAADIAVYYSMGARAFQAVT